MELWAQLLVKVGLSQYDILVGLLYSMGDKSIEMVLEKFTNL